MIVLRLSLITALAASAANPQQTPPQQASLQIETVPASCPLTPRPAKEFIPPADYHAEKLPENHFYIGSEKLWTVIREPMIWQWRPLGPGHERDLTAKIFWYRVGYTWRTEPVPD